MAPPESHLAKAVRFARVDAEMTPEDLGLAIDMAPSEISRLERGDRKPRYDTMKRLAEGLDVHCWQLVWLAEQLEAGVRADDLAWPPAA
jgi:transcriptional regulator with XRE-family HTH domain